YLRSSISSPFKIPSAICLTSPVILTLKSSSISIVSSGAKNILKCVYFYLFTTSLCPILPKLL
ncbi:hypothetical protein, partial [Clostridium sp.]|uniref:hypothetical protein n=1 Tax=Clostridium sp. TaxID=1506 RepID=UPI003F8021F6